MKSLYVLGLLVGQQKQLEDVSLDKCSLKQLYGAFVAVILAAPVDRRGNSTAALSVKIWILVLEVSRFFPQAVRLPRPILSTPPLKIDFTLRLVRPR